MRSREKMEDVYPKLFLGKHPLRSVKGDTTDVLYKNRFEKWALASEHTTEYHAGARVWIPHEEKVWEGAKVTENYASSVIKLVTDDGEVKELKVSNDAELPPLRNPDILIGENDLTSLSYLHEPAVLYNLQIRFCRHKAIYTYCGIVLVAINPYQDISIYGPDTIWAYRNRAMGDLDPHIFAVAEEAYTKMERESSDQSIIVSGESGAGKTVSAKYAMRYFATVGGSATETQVERKVLASSPIMEAIGNAKTIRNDNSSRFGKYIELQFSRHYRIVGASMRTYLLEKSRVVFQSTGERNYHIFYQMCAARDSLPHLSLGLAAEYNYLCDSECTIAGVDDGRAYEETASALSTLGFSQSDITDIFSILASVLHLGNIYFEHGSHGDDSSSIRSADYHLTTFCSLLGIDSNELQQWLCHRRIVSMRETFNKPMSVKEASGARDALAKHIYAQLFAWIVDMVNKALNTSGESKIRFIGVLDIYGFETFDINSFEQFCINYANEKLQQQFNLHVFKLEQEEYLKENIEWKFIDFYDNQPCIDLIESKLGILDLLDEECRMPKGSDSSWAEKLYAKCSQRTHFVKPRFGTNSFIVKHFADKVEYDVSGFLEKNRDTVIEEQVTVLKGSSNRLVTKLFCEPGETDSKLAVPKPRVRVSIQQKATPIPQPATRNKKTVGSQFRDSLNALMGTLNATTPHYIRCIKPNDEKAPFKYNARRAVQQLRACGVLETIRISAAGFPSRWLYIEFFIRYRVLCCSKDINRNDMQLTCQTILNKLIKDNDKYKFGRTKIFFRAGQVAYLERLRSERLLEVVVRIQKTVRGFLVRRRYTRTLKATNTMQRYVRGFLARRRAEGMRRNKAATKIQACVRCYLARTKYLRLRRTALGLQTRGRGLIARKTYLTLKKNKAAITIQRNVRGWLARNDCAKKKTNIILIQATVRRFLARKRFRLMKREARSAEHLKKLNKGLENKIISLQQKLGEMGKELKGAVTENVELKLKVEYVKTMEVELKSLTKSLKAKDAEVETLQRQWEDSSTLLKEREKEIEALKLQKKSLEAINTRLQNEVSALRTDLVQLKQDQQDEVRAQLEEARRGFESDRADERARYQKLLAERDFLETKLEAAEAKQHKRSSSDVSTISAQDEDVGYASVRSAGSSIRDETPTPDYHMDLGLVLKYQQKLRELEVENYRLRMKLDSARTPSLPHNEAEPLIIQDLEMENSKLRNDLMVLKECIAADAINESSKKSIEEITRAWRESEREVGRLKAESMELRRMFNSSAMSAKSLAESSYSSLRDLDSSIINEDGELVLAFEAQKRILRQLEDELQMKTKEWETERELLGRELDKVRGELERERAAATSGSPSAYFEEHVTRLCSENLDLQEKLDQQSAKCRRLAQQVADLKKRLSDVGLDEGDVKSATKTEKNVPIGLPTVMVRKKEREYSGMFEIKAEDINVMLRHLLELKPRVAITLLPGLPAYILFMTVRYTDHINDENMVQSILLGYRKSLMKLLRKKGDEVDVAVLWLSNTLRLIHNLKQYSGEKHFAKENTQTQNEQSLKNFDLSEFRQVLSDTAVSVCQTVMRTMEEKIQPLAVSAILEHEAIPGLASSGARARSGSSSSSLPTVRKAMCDLQSYLTHFHRSLTLHSVDPELFAQFFRQLFYYLCANALNNLLLRREYCHWTKGMQIRFNLSHLEQWARENKIQDPRVLEVLSPIIQASQLLQARKHDNDVEPVAEMCTALSANQIIKLLNLYTGDGVEERVSESFIEKMQKYLTEHRPSNDNTLMMDVKYTFPLEFPFNPSNIRLEDIDIPDILNLPMLRKL